MTTPNSVLGVLGVCRVGFGYPTQFRSFICVGFRLLCWVCWVWRRVRACVTLFALNTTVRIFSYARTEKPNKPNTLNSKLIRVLILKGFICVGFVLGSGFFVSGSVFRGVGR
jgi:hypothetical protein